MVDTWMEGWTHRQMQAMTLPRGQNWPQLKTEYGVFIGYCNFEKGTTNWNVFNNKNSKYSTLLDHRDITTAQCIKLSEFVSNDYFLWHTIDRSHVTTAIWWPLGVAVVSVTCMRVRWVSHTWKYTQWNIFLFESSDKSPYWTNPYHVGFRYEASLNFHTYFGQCPNDINILLHIPLSCLSKLPAHGANDCHGP